jgi:drug/metabolite transporter (DMT)-like permease
MNIKITLLLVLALFSVSTSPIIGRALENVGAISISFWRMFFASALLWMFSALKPQGKIKYKENRNKIIYAGILLGFHFALFFEAIKITSISNATFLGTLAPFFTLILELYVFKRKFSRIVLLGLMFTLFGSFIILFYDFDLSTKFTIGNLYALLCSVCLAVAFIIAEKVRENESTIVYTRTLYLSSAFTLFVISIIFNENLLNYTYLDFSGLLFLGLVPTIIGHNSIYYAIKYVSPTIVAAFPLGEPIIATILAYFLFYESITFNIFLGGSLTLFGLILISRYKKS